MTREQILLAAASQFSEHGYQATSVRRIGQAAGVDAKLVHYYFGTKEDLFVETITEAFRSSGLAGIITEADRVADLSPGSRYLVAVLTVIEDPDLGPAFIGLVRNLGTHEESRRIFLRFVTEEILGRIAPQLSRDHAETRFALMGTQILGLVVARYVLKVPPLAPLSVDDLARIVGPSLDRYLLDDLDW